MKSSNIQELTNQTPLLFILKIIDIRSHKRCKEEIYTKNLLCFCYISHISIHHHINCCSILMWIQNFAQMIYVLTKQTNIEDCVSTKMSLCINRLIRYYVFVASVETKIHFGKPKYVLLGSWYFIIW